MSFKKVSFRKKLIGTGVLLLALAFFPKIGVLAFPNGDCYRICDVANRLPLNDGQFKGCPTRPEFCGACKTGHILDEDKRTCFEKDDGLLTGGILEDDLNIEVDITTAGRDIGYGSQRRTVMPLIIGITVAVFFLALVVFCIVKKYKKGQFNHGNGQPGQYLANYQITSQNFNSASTAEKVATVDNQMA